MATLRRRRSACTKSTAERKRACRNVLGHASGTCIFSWSSLPASVSSSNAAAPRRKGSCSANHRASPAATLPPASCQASLRFPARRDPRRSPDASFIQAGKVADAQTLHIGAASKSSLLGTLATSPGSGPLDGIQHQHRVLDGARHWAQLIERPAQRHGAGAWHTPEGRTQASDAAAHGRADDAAAGLAADGEAD